MKLKVEEIDERVWLDDGRAGGIEMDLSARSQHIAGMNLQVGDIVEMTITKIKPVQKKVAKKPVKKKKAKKKK